MGWPTLRDVMRKPKKSVRKMMLAALETTCGCFSLKSIMTTMPVTTLGLRMCIPKYICSITHPGDLELDKKPQQHENNAMVAQKAVRMSLNSPILRLGPG